MLLRFHACIFSLLGFVLIGSLEAAELRADIVARMRASGAVRSIAFSPQGRVAVTGRCGTLNLWHVATGVEVRRYTGFQGCAQAVSFSHDGRYLLSGSSPWHQSEKTLRLWDIATGNVVHDFATNDEIREVAFSLDDRFVISRVNSGTLQLWEVRTGSLLRRFGPQRTLAFAFLADGKTVFVAGCDVYVEEARRCERISISYWDIATGHNVETLSDTDKSTIILANERFAFFRGEGESAILLDLTSRAPIKRFEKYQGPNPIAISPDGLSVLSTKSTKLTLWNLKLGKEIWNAEVQNEIGTTYGNKLISATFSPDGRLAASGDANGETIIWSAVTGKKLLSAGPNNINQVAISSDGRFVLAGGNDKTLRLWEVTTGRELRAFSGHKHPISVAALSKSTALAIAGMAWAWEGGVKIWNVATGEEVRSFRTSRVRSAAFSPDDKFALWNSDHGGPYVLELATGRWKNLGGRPSPVDGLATSPDGRLVVAGGGVDDPAIFNMWDISSGEKLRSFRGHKEAVIALTFSNDGKLLLSGDYDGALKLWEVDTAREVRILGGHKKRVTSVAFSPDGLLALSGSEDSTLKLWDVATGSEMHTFAGHDSSVSSVGFLDGFKLVSSSFDGTIRVWSVQGGKELVRMVAGPDGEWLAATVEGFFSASQRGTRMVGIVRGLEVTTMDEIHQSLFNPDLVLESLAGDPNGEVREAAKAINLVKVLDSGPAPLVAIISPAEGSESAKDLTMVTARIEDRGKGIGRIEWRVNGVTAGVGAKPKGSGPVYTVTQQLALDPGDNTIEVAAYNASNLLASLPARTTIKFTGPSETIKPKLHILAIGINAYVDRGWVPPGSTRIAFAPLGLAVKDAKTFAASMQKAAGGLYSEVRVTLALDKNATRANLEKTVAKVAREVHPRDSFILFAAGHGFSVNGRYYLIPQDFQGGTNPNALAARAVGQDRLQDWLANRIKAKRAIILLDTCESGALVGGHARSRTDAPASEAAVGRLHEATGRPVLTAAAVGQFAHEGVVGASGERHGVFTWALIDALRNGDSNGNGSIELSELVRHVQSVVPKIAAELGGKARAATAEPVFGKQHVRSGSRGEDFALARRLQ